MQTVHQCFMHTHLLHAPWSKTHEGDICVYWQGVQEHAFFFKSIANANALRQRVCECFERAALPQTSQQVCSFVSLA